MNERARIRTRLDVAKQKVFDEVRLHSDVRRYQHSREIFESNKIEGLGPSLQRTNELLDQYRMTDVHDAMFNDMLRHSLQSDPHLVAVLGLNAAKVLSEELLREYHQRPISGSDLRALHNQICVGEWHAGGFKKWVNEIEGSTHRPPLPIDTGAHVAAMTDWISSPGELPPAVVAAVAHGWLTHIHPFTDGNGRLARLLMNLLLTGAGMPPVIVRHDTDRSRYIDALAESDRGGDIFPLVDIILDAQARFAREAGRPAALRRIIQAEFDRQTQTHYEAWASLLAAFLVELSAALHANRLNLDVLDMPSQLAFQDLVNADPSGNSWLAWVRGGRNELLLWLGYSSSEIHSQVDSAIRWPSIYISVRSGPWDPHPYRLASSKLSGGIYEVMLRPSGRFPVYLRRIGPLRAGGLRDGADEIAMMLARGASYVR